MFAISSVHAFHSRTGSFGRNVVYDTTVRRVASFSQFCSSSEQRKLPDGVYIEETRQPTRSFVAGFDNKPVTSTRCMPAWKKRGSYNSLSPVPVRMNRLVRRRGSVGIVLILSRSEERRV